MLNCRDNASETRCWSFPRHRNRLLSLPSHEIEFPIVDERCGARVELSRLPHEQVDLQTAAARVPDRRGTRVRSSRRLGVLHNGKRTS